MRLDRVDVACVFNHPLKGDVFRICVERVLPPACPLGDVLVKGNLAGHDSRVVRKALRAAGAHLL